MNYVFINEFFSKKLKTRIHLPEWEWETIRRDLQHKADLAMQRGPWSVTDFGIVAPSGDPHDYYSEAPFWWPDPKNPDGPYIRKDGVMRHDRFMGHRDAVDELSYTVLYLCIAGYLLEREDYQARAAELLRIWFLNKDTRMYPRIIYGEAIKGITEGRAAGLIVLRQFNRIVHALGFLSENPKYTNLIENLQDWFSAMLQFLTTHEIGLQESRSGNNHAAWWTTHVATYAAFTGDEVRLQEAFEHYRSVIIPEQIMTDGSMPRELERTLSFHYTLFHLDACALLCEIAAQRGEDLWNYETKDGRSLKKAIQYVLPYLDNPYLWKFSQINGEIPDEQLSIQLASIRLDCKDCIKVNQKRRGEGKWIKDCQERMGPLVFWPGHPMHKEG